MIPPLHRLYQLLLLFHLITAAELISSLCGGGIGGGGGTYTANSTFQSNLELLLTSLSNSSTTSTFSNLTRGYKPDRAYGLFLCRVDASLPTCHDCVQTATQGAPQTCLHSKQATVWYDTCQLRYSDQSFFSSFGNEQYINYPTGPNVTNSPALFSNYERELMGNLSNLAAYNFSSMFATGKLSYGGDGGSVVIYGLVQCTRDLSRDSCSRCLNEILGFFWKCCDSQREGGILGKSCNFQYGDGPQFFEGAPDISFIVLPPSAPAPPASLPRPPPSNRIGEDNSKGKMLEANYPHLFWTPCAAHCLDLMFEDIFKIERFKKTIEREIRVNGYIYSRSRLLNMMRSFTSNKEMVRPAKTRFATGILTLKRFQEEKRNLMKLFNSDEWHESKFSKEIVGRKIKQILVMPAFWKYTCDVLKIGGPLLTVLRMVDGEQKPAMGYIYEAMDKAKEAIAKAFSNNEDKYKDIFKIIDKRWDNQLHRSLHAAGYYLNPNLFYNNSEVDADFEIVDGFQTCLLKMVSNVEVQGKITELNAYRYAEGSFGKPFAVRYRATMPPGNRNIIIGIVISVAVAFLLTVSVLMLFRRRSAINIRRSAMNSHGVANPEEASSIESLYFDFFVLRSATANFSDINKLGQGGFGAVYKGTLPNGQEIAVKRLSANSKQGIEELKNELVLVAKLQHRNLVRLRGVCLEGGEKLLVYEYMPNGSLDRFLFDPIKRKELDWEKRFKIIGGIARGLLYLHEESPLKVIHRDLKASNVLLDANMKPKIADFGLARLFGEDETQDITSRVVGTFGYMAPEYARRGRLSTKLDLYSYGILVLEIVSGRKNSIFKYDSQRTEDVLSYAWKHWRNGTTLEIIDPSLGESYSSHEVLRCIQIALLCAQEFADNRPSMSSVFLMLNSPSMPLMEPVLPTFLAGLNMANSDISSSSLSKQSYFGCTDMSSTSSMGSSQQSGSSVAPSRQEAKHKGKEMIQGDIKNNQAFNSRSTQALPSALSQTAPVGRTDRD